MLFAFYYIWLRRTIAEIAGPDAPRRTVLKFNDVRLAVLPYKHRLWLGDARHGLDQVEELPVLIVFVSVHVEKQVLAL